ncbi:MAG: chorismate synthase [Thermoleophilia bacterium]|nr:chorismate synthase [Thermoleophilia bacterium]
MGGLRLSTAGESHGPAEVCILEGIPAGLRLTSSDIDRDLERRQRGYGRGGRMAVERDRVEVLAGLRHGYTLGTPLCLVVRNRDYVHWRTVMAPEESPAPDAQGLEAGEAEASIAASTRHEAVTVPRPGHADLAGAAKYGHADLRNVLERASARETVARVAAGAVCKRLLAEVGVQIRGRVVSIGNVWSQTVPDPTNPVSIDWQAVEHSPVGCDDPQAEKEMCAAIDEAQAAGDSLGGVFEVWAWGVCPGVGSYATLEQRLDARLMAAVGGIPAIKGVEIGDGFALAGEPGSAVHDAIYLRAEGDSRWLVRPSNHAGGIEGGTSNGMPIILRAAMKPIPTLRRPLPSVDLRTGEAVEAHVERSDVCAVSAARVVGEAMVALVLATAYLEKFAGDNVAEFQSSVQTYEQTLKERGLWRRS